MAQPQDAFNYWTRRWLVDGVPSSGENKPQKADAQVFGGILQGALTSLIEGLIIGGAVTYTTRALLFADLAHAANVLGVVYLDGTPANNGVYQKVGASGSGSWSLTNLALPSTFATDLATVIAGLAAHIGTGGAAHAVATASVAGFLAAADKAKLDGIATSADVTAAGNVGTAIHGTAAKATPVDADEVALIDSAAGNALKKLTWAALRTALGATYQTINATLTGWAGKAVPTGAAVGTTDAQTLTNKTITGPLGIVKGDVGLGNVDNTSDANKPTSSATATALAGKQAASTVLTFLATATSNTAVAVKTILALVKADVGLANVDNTSDASKPVSTLQANADATVAGNAASALASHAGNVANPHLVTKAQVGLANADNTSDANKPVSSAQATALAGKAAASDVALLQTQQADFIGDARTHPGDVPTLLTASMTGSAASRLPLAVGGPVVSDYFGAAWQVDAAAIASLPGSPGFVDVALRMDLPMNAAGKYLVFWGFERAVDPVDPSGEGIELRIQNLTKAKAAISSVVFGDLGGGAFGAGGPAFNPTVATGPIERGLVISRSAGTDVDYQVPSTTRYVSISVRIYGATGKTNVGRISYDDVSLAKTIAGSAAAVQANLDTEIAARSSGDSTLTTNKADKATTIAAAGLAAGGGSLAASRTITVPAAAQADLTDGVTAPASALLSVTPAALATLYGQHADIVGSYSAKVFSVHKGAALLSQQGYVRTFMNEYGEAAQAYPWPLAFGGYQIFPDMNGKGLGFVEPYSGLVYGMRFWGSTHKAFGVGYGPTDEAGNYAWFVDPLTGTRYDRDSAATSGFYQFASDDEDHGSNVGLLNTTTGTSAMLTYDEGDATFVSVSSTVARVVTHSTYQLGVYPTDPIAVNKGGSPDDLTVHPAGFVASRDISLVPVSMGLAVGRTKCEGWFGRGQSDWNGTKGTPVLTTTAVAAGIAKMFVGGAETAQTPGGWYDRLPDSAFASIVDLREGTNPSGGLESPMSGLAAHMVPALASDTAILLATTAVSGYDYDLQGRGTWPFDAARRACLEHIRHCWLNGVQPVFGGVTMSWGSSDNLEGMSQANFHARMITEQAYWTRLKNELYNQTGDATIYINIGTGWPEWAGQPTVFKAFWELSRQFPTKFVVVATDACRAEILRAGPGAGDVAYVHYNAEGNRRNGEITGYGLVRARAGQTHCVGVISATPNFASSYVDVGVSLMNGALTSDTALVTDPGNLGMYWQQTGGTIRTLSSAAIQNANNGDGTATVRLTLSGNPGAPTYWEVGALYGQTVSSRPDGPRSPLRDASSFLALDGVTTIHPGWMVPSYISSAGW